MKYVVTVIFACIIFIGLYTGCREEEKIHNYKEITVVKQAIPQKPKMVSEGQVRAEEKPKDDTIREEVASTDVNTATGVKIADDKFQEEREEKGYYVVKRGESLMDVAGRHDVMGDPAKWTVLFRLNMDIMSKMQIDENLPSREVFEGARLRIYTRDEQDQLLKNNKDNQWVINVLSAQAEDKIVSYTLKLLKYGYPAYISRVKVKGEDWMRLRVGFYNNKMEADRQGNTIMKELQLVEIWTTRVDRVELDDFGRYQ